MTAAPGRPAPRHAPTPTSPTGPHDFDVRATDAAGNVDPTPGSRSWTVDTTPPETDITDGPSGLTTAKSARFEFESEAGASFECRRDGGSWESCASPRDYANLADGPHSFDVRATDAIGNTDPTPASRSWTIVEDPPETVITDGPSGASRSTAASFEFASNQGGVAFECRLNGGAWEACTSPRAYSNLPDATHTFAVRAIGDDGRADPTPASSTWTVDTTAPDTSISAGPSGTSSASATFTLASGDPGAGFECRLDAGPWQSCSSTKTYSALTEGPHTFEARAVDAAGNVDSTPSARTWTVDATPPDTRVTGGPESTTSSTSVSIQFKTVAVEKNATFECRLDGGAWQACTSPRAYANLADAAYVFEVRASDPVGNVDTTPARRTWTVDTVPPDTAIDEGPTGLVPDRSATFHFTSVDAYKYECRLDGAPWALCPSRVTFSNLPDGPHTVDARAKDAGGNIDPTPASRSWTVEATPPDTDLLSGPQGTLTTRSAELTFSSPEPGTTFECSMDGSGWGACASPKSYSRLVEGDHTFSVRARDIAGNVDGTPPARTWTTDSEPPAANESHLPFPLGPSTGPVFHVSPSGADSSPGTATQPWRTVQRALDVLRPGERALIHAGTYTESLELRRACTAAEPCTVEGAPGEARPIVSDTTDHVLKTSESAAYWRIRGLTLRDSDVSSGGIVDIYGHHLELSDNELTGSGNHDMFLEETTFQVQILRNWLHHSGLGRTQQSHGIYLQGDDHLVANNLIHDHPFGFGIQVYDAGAASIVVNNTITHSGLSGIVVGGSDVSGAVVRNNVLASNEHYGISWDTSCPNDSAGATIAEHNVIFGNGRGEVAPDFCPAVSLGVGNRLSDPLFVDSDGRNLHVLGGSPALGYSLPLWTPATDNEGSARPQGGGADSGAFEDG